MSLRMAVKVINAEVIYTMQPTVSMTTAQAQAILAPFNCLTAKGISDLAEKMAVKQAVLHLASLTETHMFGIMAADWEGAIAALRSYANAFGHKPPTAVNPCNDAVYIKFNPRTGLCYASPYTGDYRGVLIAFQSDFADGVNEMCGHLPLDLFES
jgi:hypothetical protein